MPAPDPFRDIDLPLPGRRLGKVRISYDLPGGRSEEHTSELQSH